MTSPLLTRIEAAALTRRSPRQFDEKVRPDLTPHWNGRRPLFYRDEVLAWVDRQRGSRSDITAPMGGTTDRGLGASGTYDSASTGSGANRRPGSVTLSELRKQLNASTRRRLYGVRSAGGDGARIIQLPPRRQHG